MQINSDKKTILVFSDPHQEIDRVEYILKNENYDIAVCLGDWFDSFTHNSEYDLEKTCNFLKKWVFKNNFYTCIGNHDVHYLYDNRYAICSGYTPSKDTFIIDCLNNLLPSIRAKFKWYIWIDDFLCSHAGINTYHINPMVKIDKENITNWLNEQIRFGERTLEAGGCHWLFNAGAARGGRQNIGGITWQDFDCEFEPIDGIKQIVGHTPHPTILNHKLDGNLDFTTCDNLDIDCHLAQYLLIQNGKLTIKNYIDL
jgi:hypothetical protein